MGAFFTSRGAAVGELWEAVRQFGDHVDPAFALEFQQGTVVRPIAPALLQTFVDESLKVSAAVWRAALKGMIDGDTSRETPRIAAPTLLLWGEQDNFIGRHEQQALLSSIGDCRLIAYPNTGHAVHWDDPAAVARDLHAFVATLAKAGVASQSRRRVA
jgi:pimeloyl-ACP methyl ester carboxylesterase